MLLLADAFANITGLVIVGGLLLLLVIGRWHPRSGTEIMDQDRKERWGVQAEIEEGDIGEMVAAGNVRRRRRGRPEQSEAQVVEEVGEVELGRLRAERRDEG